MTGHSAQGVVKVGRKPKTVSETEIVRLITATNESTPIGNFTQLVKDMTAAGIVIGSDSVAIKAKQTSVIDENNNTIAMFSNGKLNANLIDADKIEVKHLWAKSEDGTAKVGYFGNTENMEACKIDDTTYAPLFVGADNAKNAPFHVTQDGAIYALKGIFAGELKGVTGSFYRLTAVSSDGTKSAGSIYFDGSGRITFDADIYNQGYNSAAKRGWRFYASNVWCRSAFGHRQSTLAVVSGDVMQVYPDGYDSERIPVPLERVSYDNKTVYKIPLYSPNEALSGCPIDIVVFSPIRAIGTYYYEFVPGGTGKRWMAINANDRNNDIYFSDVGGWHQLHGGETINLVYIHPEILTPSQNDKTYFGRGIFWSGVNDLNWSDR